MDPDSGAASNSGAVLRPAAAADVDRLTEVALAAKRHWGYPERLIRLWMGELTVTPALLDRHRVWVAQVERRTVAFYALAGQPPALELTHLWVDPEWMGRGVGSELLDHALHTARAVGARELRIESDPNAVGFYRRRGARVIGSVPSTPAGRRLPLLSIVVAAA